MIRSGFKDIFSYFEGSSFPLILLKTDLTVEYINEQASNKFGKYFRNKTWYTEYMSNDSVCSIIKNILAGETVIVTPPDVKEFSSLMFQPVLGKNQKPEFVRLNIEILADSHKRYYRSSPNVNFFNSIYYELHNQLKIIEMSVNGIRKSRNENVCESYIEMLNSSKDVFKNFVTTFDYIYSLMRSYNLDETVLLNPCQIIAKIEQAYPYLTVINLISGRDVFICNPKFFIETLKAIIEYIGIITCVRDINLKAYENKEHFIFVFQANKDCSQKIDFNYIEQYYLDLSVFKNKAVALGGNLITIEKENYVKVLYSIRKHIRAEFTQEFNQYSNDNDFLGIQYF